VDIITINIEMAIDESTELGLEATMEKAHGVGVVEIFEAATVPLE